MKTLFTIIFTAAVFFNATAQLFVWANTYNIENCDEVAAMAVDGSGNIVISGVYDDGFPVPYSGNAYLLKTDPAGNALWTRYFEGEVMIGDVAAIGDNLLIAGQSTGPFTYQGEQYSGGQYFMFVMMTDADGNPLWHFTDESKRGALANIAPGNTGNIALHVRNASNLGDWILIINENGDILNEKEISSNFTLVMDIAYHNNRLYFNGGFNGPGTVTVDTILIELPDFENASITMGFDETMTAKWLYTGQTINNQVGRIEAGENGLFVYEPLVDNNFNSIQSLKKFSFEGDLITETELQVYSPFASIRPDMVVTPSMIGLFAQNNNNSTSHKVFLYDHDLNVEDEKIIDGPTGIYGGQIAAFGDDFFVTHVHSANLNFNNELTLQYSGGPQPYIAKISNSPFTSVVEQTNGSLQLFPNPATDVLNITLSGESDLDGTFKVLDLSGRVYLTGKPEGPTTRINTSRLAAGIYLVEILNKSGLREQRKVLVK